MQNKIIVHLLTKARMEDSSFVAEIDAMVELSWKYWIKNVIFYKWDVIKFDALISKLEKFHILLKNYANKDDLKEQVLNLNKEFEIVFVSTPLELLVNVTNEVKIVLWHTMSDDPGIFRDKYLQRELIQFHNPELWIKFLKWEPEELNIEIIEEKVWYPFIIKPTNWLQSAWVEKIENRDEFNEYIDNYQAFHDRLKNRWVENKILIVEEFIDWKLYSIDYFVTSFWEPIISKPVKVKLWIHVWIDDYCNIARSLTKKTEDEFKWKRLKNFINSTVKATWIRNTFVHHEFKVNLKWELKTIELNWRIWWGRLEVVSKAYGLNLYEFIINPLVKPWILKFNNIAINIYAHKRWILKWFNEKLFNKIEKRSTVYEIEKITCAVWKEIWFTRDWFVKVWVIKIQSKDYKEIRKDYLYIKRNYQELLEIE